MALTVYLPDPAGALAATTPAASAIVGSGVSNYRGELELVIEPPRVVHPVQNFADRVEAAGWRLRGMTPRLAVPSAEVFPVARLVGDTVDEGDLRTTRSVVTALGKAVAAPAAPAVDPTSRRRANGWHTR